MEVSGVFPALSSPLVVGKGFPDCIGPVMTPPSLLFSRLRRPGPGRGRKTEGGPKPDSVALAFGYSEVVTIPNQALLSTQSPRINAFSPCERRDSPRGILTHTHRVAPQKARVPILLALWVRGVFGPPCSFRRCLPPGALMPLFSSFR